MDLVRELKKLWNIKVAFIPIVNGALDIVIFHFLFTNKRNGRLWTSGDHPNYCIIAIGQNTEKSPEDLRRVAVTQIPVKCHQIMLM